MEIEIRRASKNARELHLEPRSDDSMPRPR